MYQKPINQLLFLLSSFILFSCLDSDLDSLDINDESDLKYGLASDMEEGDPYAIVAVIPLGNYWDVIVEYSGGCEEHVFNLALNKAEESDSKTQVELVLWHDANGDACEALVRDTLKLDVNRASAYQYQQEDAYVSVKNASDNRVVAIDPYLAQLTNDKCDLEGKIVAGKCALNVWQGQWILVKDSVPNHGQVWLQPVKLAQGVQVRAPTAKLAKFAVTVLFGFDYSGDSDSDTLCKGELNQTVIPVVVNCYQP